MRPLCLKPKKTGKVAEWLKDDVGKGTAFVPQNPYVGRSKLTLSGYPLTSTCTTFTATTTATHTNKIFLKIGTQTSFKNYYVP